MKKRITAIVLAAAAFLAALGLTLYPVISTRYNEIHRSKIRVEHQEKMEAVDRTGLAEIRKRAEAYNEAIRPRAASPNGYSRKALEAAAEGYPGQLNAAGDGIMGFVELPQIRVNLPIFHGTDDMTLEAGIGHLLGSSLPIGGENTHTVLTGHSGMANEKFFSDLPQIRQGEVFFVHVLDETHAYKVNRIRTVLPHETGELQIENGKDQCTLVTCVPFGVNTHRLLVTGSRIPYEEAEEIMEKLPEPVKTSSNWEQQYRRGLILGGGIAGAVLLAAGFLSVIRRYRRGKK